MKIGTITKTNAKGQVVIPLAYRQSLHITEEIPLHITQRGQGIYITPVAEIVEVTDVGLSYLQVLAKTKGCWSEDEWSKGYNRQRKQELTAVRQYKRATW